MICLFIDWNFPNSARSISTLLCSLISSPINVKMFIRVVWKAFFSVLADLAMLPKLGLIVGPSTTVV